MNTFSVVQGSFSGTIYGMIGQSPPGDMVSKVGIRAGGGTVQTVWSEVMAWTVIASIINLLTAQFIYPYLPYPAGSALFNAGRLVIALAAGWFLGHDRARGFWKSAAAGAVVCGADPAMSQAGMSLITAAFHPSRQAPAALGGIIASWALFLPVFSGAGLAGWTAAFLRAHARKAQTK